MGPSPSPREPNKRRPGRARWDLGRAVPCLSGQPAHVSFCCPIQGLMAAEAERRAHEHSLPHVAGWSVTSDGLGPVLVTVGPYLPPHSLSEPQIPSFEIRGTLLPSSRWL